MAKKYIFFFRIALLCLAMAGVPGQKDPAAQGVAAQSVTGSAKGSCAPGEVLVKFREMPVVRDAVPLRGTEAEQYAAALPGEARVALEQIHGTAVRAHPGIGLLKVKLPETVSVDQAVDTLYSSGTVEYAEPNYRVHVHVLPDDPRFDDQWALNNTGRNGGAPDADIDAAQAWNTRKDGSRTIVAVIDSGVAYNHEDLAGNLWKNPNEKPKNGKDDDDNGWVDDVYGINTIDGDGDPADDDDHGTHCAGIIGAGGDNGKGVSGVCWKAKIMALKFLDYSGNGTTEDAVTCINYALAVKAANGYPRMVLNNSWGGEGYSKALYSALKSALEAGVLVVASVGNDKLDIDASPVYPAAYGFDNIISVGASSNTDRRASFGSLDASNYGFAGVDLFAPGKNILSTVTGGKYASFSGTSEACAVVSGAAALLWSRYPTLDWKRIKALILNGVEDGQADAFTKLCLTEGRLNLNKSMQSSVLHAPAIFSATPSTAYSVGTKITVTGINFGAVQGTGKLEFQRTALTVTSWNDEKIVAKIPDSLPTGYGRLTVSTERGTSRGAAFGRVTAGK